METSNRPGRGHRAPPCAMVIFGASGDLTARKLIPALYHLCRDKQMPTSYQIIGLARREKTDRAIGQVRTVDDQILRIGHVVRAGNEVVGAARADASVNLCVTHIEVMRHRRLKRQHDYQPQDACTHEERTKPCVLRNQPSPAADGEQDR